MVQSAGELSRPQYGTGERQREGGRALARLVSGVTAAIANAIAAAEARGKNLNAWAQELLQRAVAV